jgi:hypothetical protein
MAVRTALVITTSLVNVFSLLKDVSEVQIPEDLSSVIQTAFPSPDKITDPFVNVGRRIIQQRG